MSTCTTCQHPERNEIDRQLAIGTPSTDIADRYHLNERAVRRHASSHLPTVLVQAVEAAQEAVAFDVLVELQALYTYARTIRDGAMVGEGDKQKPYLALAANRDMRDTAALIAKIGGQLDERPQLNLTVSAEWIEIRLLLMDVLAPYPDARAAAAKALQDGQP